MEARVRLSEQALLSTFICVTSEMTIVYDEFRI